MNDVIVHGGVEGFAQQIEIGAQQFLRQGAISDSKRALGWLAGRFSFKTWVNGDLMLLIEASALCTRQRSRN